MNWRRSEMPGERTTIVMVPMRVRVREESPNVVIAWETPDYETVQKALDTRREPTSTETDG